jgi:hypothetical protein
MQLGRDEAAFLLVCLRFLAEDAPCQARIERVVSSVAGPDADHAGELPDVIYARSLALAAVLWTLDSGNAASHEHEIAERVLEAVWNAGPIRPELVAAQLQCLVAQEPGSQRCRWTCPSMIRANAGYAATLGIARPGAATTGQFPGLDPLPDVVLRISSAVRAAAPVATAGRVRCGWCGLPGRLLGIDPDDGWTLVLHGSEGTPGQARCRYLAQGHAPLADDDGVPHLSSFAAGL